MDRCNRMHAMDNPVSHVDDSNKNNIGYNVRDDNRSEHNWQRLAQYYRLCDCDDGIHICPVVHLSRA